MSWTRWRGRMPYRSGRPQCIVRVCWVCLVNKSDGLAWTPISGRASGMFRWENMETEWSMFFVAIAEAAAPCCGHKPHACHSSSPITLLVTCGPLKLGMMSGWKRILGMTGLKWHVVHQPNMIKMPACPVNLILGSKSRKPTKQSESLLAGVCTWMCDENK